jgi:hypothetical protein
MQSIVKKNTEKNRLYIIFGELRSDEFQDFADRIIETAKELERGFTCISDLRAFKIVKVDHCPGIDNTQLKRVQLALGKFGMSQHVRIADSQARLFSSLAAGEKEAAYATYLFEDFDEAEMALDTMNE